jgi:hypothetical protein
VHPALVNALQEQQCTTTKEGRGGELGGLQQYLQQVIRLFIGLGKKTQRKRRNRVVAPGSEKRHEEGLAILLSAVSYGL